MTRRGFGKLLGGLAALAAVSLNAIKTLARGPRQWSLAGVSMIDHYGQETQHYIPGQGFVVPISYHHTLYRQTPRPEENLPLAVSRQSLTATPPWNHLRTQEARGEEWQEMREKLYEKMLEV